MLVLYIDWWISLFVNIINLLGLRMIGIVFFVNLFVILKKLFLLKGFVMFIDKLLLIWVLGINLKLLNLLILVMVI